MGGGSGSCSVAGFGTSMGGKTVGDGAAIGKT
jgi:hypothetical protein